ncbi:low temperature requirement protein A [Streptococcus sp. zg-JUN1979]|uniref:low temperature requirement protein A n=1 Tax=Streptococcus sp. zg-JUN1979 TaxID=3391450 RepID=UPI0039A679F4
MTKKVEMSELFFDLVFVYAISKMTALIHHLHEGIIPLSALIAFMLCLIVVINTWMYQTVFTNRYGKNSIWDHLFLQAEMIAVLFLSNNFSLEGAEALFRPFSVVVGVISLLILGQYLRQVFRCEDDLYISLAKSYVKILAIRTGLVFLGVFLPYQVGIYVVSAGILLGMLLPISLEKKMQKTPVIVPHLLERLSLLVIITFGEMLIGIAPYFSVETLSVTSVLVFILVLCLFFFYVMTFERFVNHHAEQETGVSMIYLYYPMFIGLSFVTVSLSVFESDVNRLFWVVFCYLGLYLFYSGLLAQRHYNHDRLVYSKNYLLKQAVIFGVGLCLSLFLRENAELVLLLTTAMTGIILLNHYLFYQKQVNSPKS